MPQASSVISHSDARRDVCAIEHHEPHSELWGDVVRPTDAATKGQLEASTATKCCEECQATRGWVPGWSSLTRPKALSRSEAHIYRRLSQSSFTDSVQV